MMNDANADTSSKRRERANTLVMLSEETLSKYKVAIKSAKGANEFLILCAFGSVETVRALLIDDKTLISSQNNLGMNAALFACYGGNVEVAKFLHEFYPELFDKKTERGLGCKEIAALSLQDITEIKSWLSNLEVSKSAKAEKPNTKRRRKENSEVDENKVDHEISKAQYYLDCFRGLENLNLLTAAFLKDQVVESVHHFKESVRNLEAVGVQNANGLGMNVFHFACYGANHYAVEYILQTQPHLLTSLTAEGLSGLDVFDKGFGENPNFRKWLEKKNPEFFKQNAKLVAAAEKGSAPEEQKSDYDTLIQSMIDSANKWNLGGADVCYVNLCTALQSVDMAAKYDAVQGFLLSACKVQNVEGVILGTTLSKFQDIYKKVTSAFETTTSRER